MPLLGRLLAIMPPTRLRRNVSCTLSREKIGVRFLVVVQMRVKNFQVRGRPLRRGDGSRQRGTRNHGRTQQPFNSHVVARQHRSSADVFATLDKVAGLSLGPCGLQPGDRRHAQNPCRLYRGARDRNSGGLLRNAVVGRAQSGPGTRRTIEMLRRTGAKASRGAVSYDPWRRTLKVTDLSIQLADPAKGTLKVGNSRRTALPTSTLAKFSAERIDIEDAEVNGLQTGAASPMQNYKIPKLSAESFTGPIFQSGDQQNALAVP